MKKNIKYIVAGLIFLLVILAGAFYYYTTTPRYTISQMSAAAKEGNYDKFDDYVSEDELFDNLEVAFRSEVQRLIAEDEDLQNNPVGGLAESFAEGEIRKGVAEMRTDFRKGVENKESFQKEPKYDTIKTDGDKFTIESDSDTGKSLLSFRKVDGKWKLYNIEAV